jgi:oligopeptide transport system permease protein
MVVLKPGLTNIFIALGMVYWLQMARIVRGQVLALREQEYIVAAKLIGASPWRIILRHLVPNCMGPIIVTMTLAIPEAIFTEAFLSFIGLGVSAPMASWGVLASEGVTSLHSYPFQLFYPALAISVTMLSFNFLGDGLRDALDPRMRK